MSTTRIPLPPFRTVLFAADFSNRSQDAFEAACSLAREEATRLIVLHVQEPVGFLELSGPAYVPGVDLPDPEVLREQLRGRYVPHSPLPAEYRVARGPAANEILRTADEERCDLIVMGTQGLTGLERLLLGSVAEAVLRRAGCPVMTVRSPSSGPAPGEPTVRTILHPTDFSRHSEGALRVARALARDRGAQLVLAHVVAPSMSAVVVETMVDLEIGRDALKDARLVVEGPDLKYPVEAQLRRGEAAPEILRAASELGCDLIVMGSHGRSGLGRLLMGSVAEQVLRGAECPVLTIKVPSPSAAAHASAEALIEA